MWTDSITGLSVSRKSILGHNGKHNTLYQNWNIFVLALYLPPVMLEDHGGAHKEAGMPFFLSDLFCPLFRVVAPLPSLNLLPLPLSAMVH